MSTKGKTLRQFSSDMTNCLAVDEDNAALRYGLAELSFLPANNKGGFKTGLCRRSSDCVCHCYDLGRAKDRGKATDKLFASPINEAQHKIRASTRATKEAVGLNEDFIEFLNEGEGSEETHSQAFRGLPHKIPNPYRFTRQLTLRFLQASRPAQAVFTLPSNEVRIGGCS